MTNQDFVREIDALRVYRHEYVGKGLLDSLEAVGLLHPRIRIRYPDEVARRFWSEMDDREPPRRMRHPLEPDGARWEAAVALKNALHRRKNWIAYGLSDHPLDDPDPRFAQFLERPSELQFLPRLDRRVDVGNDEDEELFDDLNCDERFSTWQILLAAELADAGIQIRMDLGKEGVLPSVWGALTSGRLPEGAGFSLNLMPTHVVRAYLTHERTLDAVTWFAEERQRALDLILGAQGGRFCLNPTQSARYEEATRNAANEASARFGVGADDYTALLRYFAERWSEWRRDGRPLIADAYEAFLEQCVLLARRMCGIGYVELRDRVGAVGGWHKPVLDAIWPDWTADEKERTALTLRSAFTGENATIELVDFDAFMDFISSNGLEAFFWRLRSFEEHALRGNEFAVEGMKSDVQGMAVVVEHVAASLGATQEQLFEKFKQLWRDPNVASLLKRPDVAPLARQKRLAADWPALRTKIDALRLEPGGAAAADLVMAHRIRGGVHAILPEDDHFELEALFVGLMRVALMTFVEVRRYTPALGAQAAPS